MSRQQPSLTTFLPIISLALQSASFHRPFVLLPFTVNLGFFQAPDFDKMSVFAYDEGGDGQLGVVELQV